MQTRPAYRLRGINPQLCASGAIVEMTGYLHDRPQQDFTAVQQMAWVITCAREDIKEVIDSTCSTPLNTLNITAVQGLLNLPLGWAEGRAEATLGPLQALIDELDHIARGNADHTLVRSMITELSRWAKQSLNEAFQLEEA